MVVRGQPHAVGSLLPPLYGFWVLNSGHQACITGQQAPLLMDPSHIPIQNTLNIGFFSFTLRAWAFNA